MHVSEGRFITDVTLCGKFQNCFCFLYCPLGPKKWVSSGFSFSYLKIFLKTTPLRVTKGISNPWRLLSHGFQAGISDFLDLNPRNFSDLARMEASFRAFDFRVNLLLILCMWATDPSQKPFLIALLLCFSAM